MEQFVEMLRSVLLVSGIAILIFILLKRMAWSMRKGEIAAQYELVDQLESRIVDEILYVSFRVPEGEPHQISLCVLDSERNLVVTLQEGVCATGSHERQYAVDALKGRYVLSLDAGGQRLERMFDC